MTDPKTDDKTPAPINSEQAQKGGQAPTKGQPLERANPKTETVDKVITPTSIKETEQRTDAIHEEAAKVERKLGE